MRSQVIMSCVYLVFEKKQENITSRPLSERDDEGDRSANENAQEKSVSNAPSGDRIGREGQRQDAGRTQPIDRKKETWRRRGAGVKSSHGVSVTSQHARMFT